MNEQGRSGGAASSSKDGLQPVGAGPEGAPESTAFDLRSDWVDLPIAVGVLLMLFHVSANALARWLAGHPLQGTLEYVTYWYMPIIALAGMCAAQRRDQHIDADVIFDRFSALCRTLVRGANYLVGAGACVGFAYFGGKEAWHAYDIRLTGGVVGVVIWPALWAAPLAFGIMALQYLRESARVLASHVQTSRDVRVGEAVHE